MSNTSPPTLLVAAQRLQTGSAQARDWVTEVARSARTVAGEEQSLVEATRRSQNLGRKLAASATRRNCVGVCVKNPGSQSGSDRKRPIPGPAEPPSGARRRIANRPAW